MYDNELIKNAGPSFEKAYEKIRKRMKRFKGSSKGISEYNTTIDPKLLQTRQSIVD